MTDLHNYLKLDLMYAALLRKGNDESCCAISGYLIDG